GGGDLGPAAGRRAEVDDAQPRLQQIELLVELQQLEGGTAAVAARPRLGDERIVDLALQPEGRGQRALLGGLDALLQAARPAALPTGRPTGRPAVAGAALAASLAGALSRAGAAAAPTCHAGRAVPQAAAPARTPPPVAPPCMRVKRMPSRRPRSATRSRPIGQVRQIASRIAQPAITRSAR